MSQPEPSPQPPAPEAGPLAAVDLYATPAMRQYQRFKLQHPGCILFFRMGDFYEMFHDDARLAHRVLGVALTQRTPGVPMAGVPYHAVEGYLRRMIQAGHRVAVCEQVEDPAQAKGIVQREVTRVVTPGTLTDESLLEEGRTQALAAVMFLGEGSPAGSAEPGPGAALAWTDLSTGAFHAALLEESELLDELARITPGELLHVETATREPAPRAQRLIDALGCAATGRPAWQFRQDEAVRALRAQFEVALLQGLGLDERDPALGPAGAVLHYLLETQRSADGKPVARIAHLQPPKRFSREEHLVIDQPSLRSLEIERTARSGELRGSLLGTLTLGPDGPRTAMGKRALRQWLCYPLRRREEIEGRQDVVQALVGDERLRTELRGLLDTVHDVERIAARVAVRRATPRDLAALGRSCLRAADLFALIDGVIPMRAQARVLAPACVELSALGRRLESSLVELPPSHLRDGGVIRDGCDAALDECRLLQRDSHDWLARYQATLVEQTGVPSLKVGFNKVFGYYIELSAAQREKAPAQWSRRQTLKNAERFVTPELRDFEARVLTANQRAIDREQALFDSLCEAASRAVEALQAFAGVVASLDALAGLASRAARRGHTRPLIVDTPELQVRAGRHPVLEELLGEGFVPNDLDLGGAAGSLALITGPNMAGKSTYIRQAAILTLLAHCGAFVPAESARIGLTDRIFTRIGASDELHAGQSTFMVEMVETANLCRHATPASLLVLDEIGRGTGTLDGLSLAWAIAEHLAARGCRTLFATHYHELTQLAERAGSVRNLNVAVREWRDEVVFLHRIVPGAADRSYGIHVAKIAGLPEPIVRRAHELMEQLEVSQRTGSPARAIERRAPRPRQLSLFTEYLEHPALRELRGMDLAGLTPMRAFDELRRLQQLAADQAPPQA